MLSSQSNITFAQKLKEKYSILLSTGQRSSDLMVMIKSTESYKKFISSFDSSLCSVILDDNSVFVLHLDGTIESS